MKISTCFITIVVASIIICCVETKFRRGGGFRFSGGRSRSWFSRSSSSRRAFAVPTPTPHRYYSGNNYQSRWASRVPTVKPIMNVRQNLAIDRRISSTQVTPRSYPMQNSGNSGTYIHSYPLVYPDYSRRYNDRINHTKVDNSGTRNAVLAGLGGSVLGLYLGNELGKMQDQHITNPNSVNNSQYSVIHHYYHGNYSIIKNAKLDSKVITQCNNITLCVPKSQTLCLTNGTIYCISPMKDVQKCNTTAGEAFCLNTTLSVLCQNATDPGCNGIGSLKQEKVRIPCVTNLFISRKLSAEELRIHRILAENSSPISDSTELVNEVCVTVIAESISRGSANKILQ